MGCETLIGGGGEATLKVETEELKTWCGIEGGRVEEGAGGRIVW